jgi:hypothetical protein
MRLEQQQCCTACSAAICGQKASKVEKWVPWSSGFAPLRIVLGILPEKQGALPMQATAEMLSQLKCCTLLFFQIPGRFAISHCRLEAGSIAHAGYS